MNHRSIQDMRNQNTFTYGNIYGKWLDHDTYVVCSYGTHWILALWRKSLGWYVNSTRYSKPTTNRHQSAVDSVLVGYPRIEQSYLQDLLRATGSLPTPSALAQFTPPQFTDKQQNLFDVST